MPRILGGFVALLTMLVPLCLPALLAQSNQPVYPAYDGFMKTPDGSFVLSFAYFNANQDPVTVPPGPENSWAPAPGDRQQPTTFQPGRWRFQCVMVMDPGFDGKLRWTLSYSGTTTATTQNMLLYSWELEEGVRDDVLRAIDPAKAPRGVCLNRPPIVRFLGMTAGGVGGVELSPRVGDEVHLFGSVADEGLPRGGMVTTSWRQLSGPGKVMFSSPSEARTRASFSAPGVYELELRASDTALEASRKVTVTVVAGAAK
jgi:hypothetical protein